MKIDTVGVTYGELRSTGYPQFSNKRIEVTLSARMETGDTAEHVRERLHALAKAAVKRQFGDTDADQTEMTIPF